MADQKLVKFNTWYQGFRGGETAGFPPEEADRIVAEGVAEHYEIPKELTPREKAAAARAAEAEAAAKKKAEEDAAEEAKKAAAAAKQ